jgi:VanZ family protein
MRNLFSKSARWVPAALVMAVIFVFSSIAGPDLPNLGLLDLVGKKMAHMVVYGMLAVALWYAFEWRRDLRRLAWLLAVLYAVTDEFHQSFTPGRHPWWLDVVVFDALGALLGLLLAGMFIRPHPEVDPAEPL